MAGRRSRFGQAVAFGAGAAPIDRRDLRTGTSVYLDTELLGSVRLATCRGVRRVVASFWESNCECWVVDQLTGA